MIGAGLFDINMITIASSYESNKTTSEQWQISNNRHCVSQLVWHSNPSCGHFHPMAFLAKGKPPLGLISSELNLNSVLTA